MLLHQIVCLSLIPICLSIGNYPPTWITNSMVQAGNNRIISTLTGNSVTPTYTFNFGFAFTNLPNLGYGIKEYKGNDYFGEQKFQVNRTALTSSTFSVAVQIVDFTNIHVMCVSFIGIDPSFPHHLNSFDNVPVSYGSTLVNVTAPDPVNILYYSNTINYTQQVGPIGYNTFLTPFSRNKILLFMTSMFVQGHNQANPATGPLIPLTLTVDANVVSVDEYKIDISFGLDIKMDKLHFSIIIFDQTDVESTGLYMLVYQRIHFTYRGGFIPIPFQFIDNFIMGFTDFSTIRTKCAINFQWDFTTVNSVQGVLMPLSVGLSPLGYVIDNVGFTMFYMKTWLCPSQTVFDPTSNLCVGCPINNCRDCINNMVCNYCQTGYTVDSATGQCKEGCSTCISPTIKYQCNGFLIIIPKSLYQGSVNVMTSNQLLTITKTQQSTTQLKIYITYNTTFTNQTFDLTVTSANTFQINYNQIVPPQLYTQQQCQAYNHISNLLIVITVFSYLALLTSIITLKIVGIQLFGVLQLSYFALADHSYFDLYLSPLVQFKLFNGLNVNMIADSTILPNQISTMNVSGLFLNNFNIMLLVIFIVVLTGFILHCVGKKFAVNQKVKKVSQVLLHQGLITLIMFNIFNFSFSTGIQWKYAQSQPSAWAQNLIIAICIIGIVITLVIMEYKGKARVYGEFKLKFKDNWICKMYIVFSIIMRISLGFYLSLKNDYQQGTLIILAFSMIYVMYNIINLPFKSTLQNYRACLCHVTQLIILLTTNYYRSMKSTTSIQIKARLHSFALLEIIMIVLCVFMSLAVLTYQVYQIIKNFRTEKVVQPVTKDNNNNNNINKTHEITEQSIEILNQ